MDRYDIEIHGLGPAHAEDIRKQIFKIFNWERIRVAVVDGAMTDRNGKADPFLRIYSNVDASVLTTYLAGLGLDMRVVDAKFIPAKRNT